MTQSPPLTQTAFNPGRFDLLLQACFLTDSRAIASFEQWNAKNNWDLHFNTDEYRLFPQLYRNLAALGLEHPLLAKFKGIARKAWYDNNLFFHRFAPTLRELCDATIPVLVLAGGAFALRYFKDHVLAHTLGFGVLVPPQNARAAFEQLARAGWGPQPNVSASALDASFSARYFHVLQRQNGDRMFLQWQLLPACPAEHADAPFWERAQETVMDNVPAHILGPTDQLLHTCALGSFPGGSSRWQRSADAMLLLNAAGAEIEWDAFLARIQTHRAVLPAREILLPLAAQFKTPIPAPILEKLESLPISSDEQKNRTLWDAVTPNERVNQLWRIYARRTCNKNALALAAGFPTFLQGWWGLDSLGQVPSRAHSAFRRQQVTKK
ncbi:MAG: nucleotidyltransferase family protein [Anaerolineae bacterium]|nr:nucleotidyltransferase family protein [Anaerolineae bacterium]